MARFSAQGGGLPADSGLGLQEIGTSYQGSWTQWPAGTSSTSTLGVLDLARYLDFRPEAQDSGYLLLCTMLHCSPLGTLSPCPNPARYRVLCQSAALRATASQDSAGQLLLGIWIIRNISHTEGGVDRPPSRGAKTLRYGSHGPQQCCTILGAKE